MKTNRSKFLLSLGGIALSLLVIVACNTNSLGEYSGTPYQDQVYREGAQIIPGKLQCEYYDFGGEGIAFHDSDSENSGSGGLNKTDGSYLHEFRIRKFQTGQLKSTGNNHLKHN